MRPACRDLLGLQDRWENRRNPLRRRSREETRAIQEFKVPEVIQDIQDLPAPLGGRRARRENQEKQANEANPVKMATPDVPASRAAKESPAFLVLQAETEAVDIKVNLDTQDHQDWSFLREEVQSVPKVSPGTPDHLEPKEREDQQV